MIEIPFLPEMLQSALCLCTPHLDAPSYFYTTGLHQTTVASAVLQEFPQATPILLDSQRQQLLQVRETLKKAEPMGFLNDISFPNWKKDYQPIPF